MRARGVVTLGVVALLAAGCVALDQPSAAPTAAPTEAPTAPTTLPPTLPPTPSPTEGPPTATPDPNATPRPTAIDVAPFLTSEVTVVNLGDGPLGVTVTLLDPESDDEFTIGTFELQPNQVTSQSIIPALFRLDFGFAGVDDAGSCDITIEDAEQLQFAVIPTGVVMTSNGPEPEDPAEMIVATSSRCQAESET